MDETEVWTAENEAVYRPLRRKKLRIEAQMFQWDKRALCNGC